MDFNYSRKTILCVPSAEKIGRFCMSNPSILFLSRLDWLPFERSDHSTFLIKTSEIKPLDCLLENSRNWNAASFLHALLLNQTRMWSMVHNESASVGGCWNIMNRKNMCAGAVKWVTKDSRYSIALWSSVIEVGDCLSIDSYVGIEKLQVWMMLWRTTGLEKLGEILQITLFERHDVPVYQLVLHFVPSTIF